MKNTKKWLAPVIGVSGSIMLGIFGKWALLVLCVAALLYFGLVYFLRIRQQGTMILKWINIRVNRNGVLISMATIMWVFVPLVVSWVFPGLPFRNIFASMIIPYVFAVLAILRCEK
ncbi:MAG: hypothetical protein KAW12_07330 [Candidatus Aminicenantes bacterium]|nr:hypothetical protein [Candidatus Aminicenantes bacterium]